MGLFFNSNINKLYVGNTEVKEVYLGSQQIWPVGLPAGTTFEFDYTGSVQSVELPAGRYKLQCWGAQGGDVTGSYAVNGSKGGYSEGIITLTKKTTLYIFVGGKGASHTSSASQTSTSVVNGGWNGGGAGVRTSRYSSGNVDGRSFPRGGGGATDISTVTSSLSYSSGRTTRDNASLLARCIVAGGGAGASARYTVTTETSYSYDWVEIDSASGYTPSTETSSGLYQKVVTFATTAGETYRIYASSESRYLSINISGGSTISSGSEFVAKGSWASCNFTHNDSSGVYYSCYIEHYTKVPTTSTSKSSGKSSAAQQGGGTSGRGQLPGKATSAGIGGAFGLGANQSSTNYRYCGGGGGGGWYGGGTNNSDSSINYVNYSGGGSGFVNTSANASSRPSGYTGLQLDSGTTIAGNSSFESVSGGSETGHSGNGYARITVI